MWILNTSYRRWTSRPERRRSCIRQHTVNQSVTLTFDLQNLIRSSIGANEYSCQFYRNCSSRSWDTMVTINLSDRTNKRTDVRDSLKTQCLSRHWRVANCIKTKPGLVALLDVRSGNRLGLFLQIQFPHRTVDVGVKRRQTSFRSK